MTYQTYGYGARYYFNDFHRSQRTPRKTKKYLKNYFGSKGTIWETYDHVFAKMYYNKTKLKHEKTL